VLCHVCRDAAVGRCPLCRLYYCSQHGRGICADCAAEQVQVQPRWRVRRAAPPEQVTATPPKTATPLTGTCRRCGAPAKGACPLCRDLYCAAHGGWRAVAIGDCTVRQALCARCAGPPSWGGLQLRWALAWLLLGLGLALTCFWLG
jgi:hypothetical protein